METKQISQFGHIAPLLLLLVGGTVLGVSGGYVAWNSGAANYSVILESNEVARTVRVGYFSVTFPSVLICQKGEETTLTIEIANLDDDPKHALISLSVINSSGVDSSTISALTGNTYSVTIAAFGSAIDVLSFQPTSNGYAFFDLTVKGELVGSITVYVV